MGGGQMESGGVAWTFVSLNDDFKGSIAHYSLL